MSKSSKNFKNSKAGRREKQEKAQEKTAAKLHEQYLMEVAAPAELSLREDHKDKPLTPKAQLFCLLFGALSLSFAVVYTYIIVVDFLSTPGDDYGLAEYFNSCEPAAVCRVMDVLEIVIILFLFFAGIVALKTIITNRYPRLRIVRLATVAFFLAVLFYLIDTVLNQLLW